MKTMLFGILFCTTICAITEQELKQINQFLDKKQALNLKTWSLQYEVLPNLINEVFKGKDALIGVEIGVAFGTHSKRLLEEPKINILYSVDPFKHFAPNIYIDGMNFQQKIHDVLFERVKQLLSPFGPRTQLLRMTSIEAAKQFEDESIDFVYIDANHSYKNVKQDLQAWWPKVKSGGIFAGDDYGQSHHPGVKKAVDEFFKSKNLKLSKKPIFFYWTLKP